MQSNALHSALFAGLALALSSPAMAQAQIGTVARGAWVCELPGNASGAAGIEQPDENFRIINASRYEADGGSGTYLRRGNRLTMTSGPRSGDAYEVRSDTLVHKLENGEPSRLRCVRSGD